METDTVISIIVMSATGFILRFLYRLSKQQPESLETMDRGYTGDPFPVNE